MITGKIFALIVALYGPSASFDHKPHLYSFFLTEEACVKAAQHFEDRFQKSVAICIEREAASPLPLS